MEAYRIWKTLHVSERVHVLLLGVRRQDIERHNKGVRQNRRTLKTIFEAVLYLSKQDSGVMMNQMLALKR